MYNNVCDPFKHLACNGAHYLSHFFDDCKHISMAFIKRFKRMVETIINQKLEILQFNHGGEYSSMEFQ